VVQAVRTGATWSTSNIGLSGLDGNPVIAVGGLGVPQVCWVTELGVEYSGPNLLWAAYDYDEWNIQLVSEDNAGQVIDSYECIADVGGHIHIAYASYVEAGRSEVYYVTNVTGQVERINVSNAPDTNDHSVHLAVDGDSVAHLTWVKDGSRDEIHYAKVAYDEIETEETISTTEDRTRLAPRVAVEPNGAAHIVWWERTATEMSGYQPTFWVSYWSNAAHMPAQPIAVGQAGFSLEPDISVVGGDPQIVYDTYLGEEEASRDLFFATGER
jgi:hypothetical protein